MKDAYIIDDSIEPELQIKNITVKKQYKINYNFIFIQI